MSDFTFLHAADLHLDAPFRGLSGALAAPDADPGAARLAAILQRATFTALDRLVDLAVREKAAFVLLAGDVYNSEESSLRARLALRDAFVRLREAGVAVFLAHGNHDPYAGPDAAFPWPDNVVVFSGAPEARPVFARTGGGSREIPVAVVHGVSHTTPAETRNLAALLRRAKGTLLDDDLFHIGLVHCALADMSGGHARYAPCTFADLAGAGMDYWALGHVHACRLLDARGKTLTPREGEGARAVAAYSGSLQGLHVNESGPHGCIVGRVRGNGLETEFVPLAPVRWEQALVEPGLDIVAVHELEALILGRLEAYAAVPDSPPGQAAPPLATLVRLTVAGRSPLDGELRKPGASEALLRHLNEELAGSALRLRDIVTATRPLMDMEALAERRDLAGEVLRAQRALGGDGAALEAFAQEALGPLFQRPKVRRLAAAPEGEELAALVEEAALVCLDLLGVDAYAAETGGNNGADPAGGEG